MEYNKYNLDKIANFFEKKIKGKILGVINGGKASIQN